MKIDEIEALLYSSTRDLPWSVNPHRLSMSWSIAPKALVLGIWLTMVSTLAMAELELPEPFSVTFEARRPELPEPFSVIFEARRPELPEPFSVIFEARRPELPEPFTVTFNATRPHLPEPFLVTFEVTRPQSSKGLTVTHKAFIKGVKKEFEEQ